jgi:hypothetical protein
MEDKIYITQLSMLTVLTHYICTLCDWNFVFKQDNELRSDNLYL